METTESPESPELLPEILYRVAEFLPRRWQLEFARASRARFALVAPLAFSRFPTSFEDEQIDRWEANGWFLRHVDMGISDAPEVEAARRILRLAPMIRSARLYFENEDAEEVVLSWIPPLIRDLSISENFGMAMENYINEGEPVTRFDFPHLRCFRYSSLTFDSDGVLGKITAGSPELEDLHIDVALGDVFGLFRHLGGAVLCKVTRWTLWDLSAFRRLCSFPTFRPSRIDMDSDYTYEPEERVIDRETMASIAHLPSVLELSLAELDSWMLVDSGLPQNLQELEISELRINAWSAPNGRSRLLELLKLWSHLRVRVDNLLLTEGASEADRAEGEGEVEIWQQRMPKPAFVVRSGNFLDETMVAQQ